MHFRLSLHAPARSHQKSQAGQRTIRQIQPTRETRTSTSRSGANQSDTEAAPWPLRIRRVNSEIETAEAQAQSQAIACERSPQPELRRWRILNKYPNRLGCQRFHQNERLALPNQIRIVSNPRRLSQTRRPQTLSRSNSTTSRLFRRGASLR